MRLMQAEQSIFIQDLVVVLATAFHFSPLSKMLCLHQSQKRYRALREQNYYWLNYYLCY